MRETADRLRKLYAPDERREEPEGLAESGERLLDADSDRIGDVDNDDEGLSAVLIRRRDWRGCSVLSPSEVMARLNRRCDVDQAKYITQSVLLSAFFLER